MCAQNIALQPKTGVSLFLHKGFACERTQHFSCNILITSA